LKLHQVFDGEARNFSDPQAWVSEGGQEFHFSKKRLFSQFRVRWKPNFTTFVPHTKTFGNIH